MDRVDRVDRVDKVVALTKNRLNKERDNNLFAQLTNEEKIEKFLSPKTDCSVLQRSKNSVLAVSCAGAREAMTPRSQSKFAHLIRNLRESNEDEQLVVYKMMETDPCSRIRVTDVVPYKGEPKVKLQCFDECTIYRDDASSHLCFKRFIIDLFKYRWSTVSLSKLSISALQTVGAVLVA